MDLEAKVANVQAVREDIAASTSSIEEITGVFAQQLLVKAGLQDYPKEKPLVVYDGMCREGILTLKLQEMLKGRPQNTFEVICGDVNETMIGLLKRRIDKEGWTNTTVTDKLAIGQSHISDEHCTHVFSNFSVNISPNPTSGLAELRRVLSPGGTLCFTNWERCPWYPDLKTAMETVPDLPKLPDPAEMETVLPNIFSSEKIWHDPEAVRKFVTQQGFVNVESGIISTTSVVKDSEELKKLVRPPMTLLTRFYWTQEQRDKLDNPETFGKVFSWFEERLRQEASISWKWTAVLTSANRPL